MERETEEGKSTPEIQNNAQESCGVHTEQQKLQNTGTSQEGFSLHILRLNS